MEMPLFPEGMVRCGLEAGQLSPGRPGAEAGRLGSASPLLRLCPWEHNAGAWAVTRILMSQSLARRNPEAPLSPSCPEGWGWVGEKCLHWISEYDMGVTDSTA